MHVSQFNVSSAKSSTLYFSIISKMGLFWRKQAEDSEDEEQENREENQFLVEDDVDIDGPRPKFEPNSCIVVIGTTGLGKTTLMNLYTGKLPPGSLTSVDVSFLKAKIEEQHILRELLQIKLHSVRTKDIQDIQIG